MEESEGSRAVLVRAAKRVRGWVRRAITAALHPGRRRRARATVRRAGWGGRILVLCTGNVCRSPYAEARLRWELSRRGVTGDAASAGFIGPDRPPPEHAVAEALRRGLDTSRHRSRLVDPGLVRESVLVVAMEPGHVRRMAKELGPLPTPAVLLGDLDPVTPAQRAVADPWRGGADDFRRCFTRIDRCLAALVDELESAAGGAAQGDSRPGGVAAGADRA